MDNTQAFFFKPPIDDNWLGHIFAEVYKDKIYAPLIEAKGLKTCIELGGNLGIASYYFSQHFQRVITLEPARDHFEMLTKMLAFNKITNVTPVNKAIYIDSEQRDFFHNKNKTMYSLHTAVNDNSSPPEKVQCITLPELFEEQKIEFADFVKLDIEGSEMEIVAHPSFREVADKIGMMLIENHAWNGRHPNQLKESLKAVGFKVEVTPNDAEIIIATR